jgi:pimeloyl-ACP methyl ester carboxylesterase
VKVRERELAIDLAFVDLDMHHLGDPRLRDQLHEEIVLPAREAGCNSLWLAGISLGGFVALDYAASQPGAWDGLCLLAPYLGNRMLTDEIARSVGLAAWAADAVAQRDDERRIWRFVQARHPGSRPIYLGYGHDDRFADAHRLLATGLPPQAVHAVPGGHDWRTWTILWENFLDSTFT